MGSVRVTAIESSATDAQADTRPETERRAPGRPRSARADGAIIDAVLDLIAEGTTVEALSIEAVAARAGVGKATIYRRWSSKDALVMDAVAALKGPLPTVAGESVRADLITVLSAMLQHKHDRAGQIMPCMIPEIRRSPELAARYRAIIEPRRQLIRDILQRGIDLGELRADIDIEITLMTLNSPMLVHNVLGYTPEGKLETLPETVVDTVLGGIRV